MKRIFAGMLLLGLLTGCGAQDASARETGGQGQMPSPPPLAETAVHADLMEGVEGRADPADGALTPEGAAALTDFGVRLFQNSLRGENALLSPLSVIEAMAMAANGAAGDTREQMERAFGLDVDELNGCLRLYADSLPDGEGGSAHLANGIWFNGDGSISVKPSFLQANRDWYGAGAFAAPFDDGTKEEINAWVKEQTKGRIDGVIDRLSPGAAMVLVNALSFDGTWENIYREDQLREGTFTAENGESRPVEMMSSTENVYLRDEQAAGFVKNYEGGGYAFAALLPDEGVSLADYAASLTGEKLQALLSGGEQTVVEAQMPKFTAEYSADMSEVLAALGMTDAFDGEKADFSALAERSAGELRVDRVMHKTFLQVDEMGTQAGAATAVEFRTMAMMGPSKAVTLDRPFLYMLIDRTYNIPLFIGAAMDVE